MVTQPGVSADKKSNVSACIYSFALNPLCPGGFTACAESAAWALLVPLLKKTAAVLRAYISTST